MTETEFLTLADSTLSAIEAALERVCNETELDVECSRSGNVLEIEFIDNGSKIIVNSQAPMQEIDVHEGIEDTLTMLGHKLKNVTVTRAGPSPPLLRTAQETLST